MRGIIRVGDPTSHGGRVISGTSRMLVDGVPVARVGDACTCPVKGHGSCVIVEGDPNFLLDGIPVAFHGCKISCGASALSTTEISGIEPLAHVDGGQVASSASASTNSTDQSDPKDCFDQHVVLVDQDGSPLGGVQYIITDHNGKKFKGKTQSNGKTEIIKGKNGEKFICKIAHGDD